MPDASVKPQAQDKWVACQLGARMHYAVPRLLHDHGLLERFHTDICSGAKLRRLFGRIPQSWQPAALKRFLDRVPETLPSTIISTYPFSGVCYFLKQRFAWTIEAQSAAHLWMGRRFGGCVTDHGFRNATAVYTFNTAALEILQAARSQGLLTVVEQTIAPRAYEEELLAEEERRFPMWSTSPRLRGGATLGTIKREADEWKLADMIVCGSPFVKEGISHCGGPAERCVVVPYGVDERFSSTTREPHGGPLRILTVGEACLRKGVSYASEVASRLKGVAEFRWVGPVSLRPEAARQVAANVQLTGAVPRSLILPHYEWADVFFLPTVCEGSATVIYEALQTGLPVVTTPNAGSVVRDGVDGFIVPIRDTAAMEACLRQWCEDRALLSRMSEEAANTRHAVSLEAYQQRLMQALGAARTTPLHGATTKPAPPGHDSRHGCARITAMVTAFERPEMTAATVRRLQACQPAPSEIRVHVDDGRSALAEQLREAFPELTVLVSTERVGPGGARNLLLQSAKEELVASFDDDSFPADPDFFQRALIAAEACPDAAVLNATLLDGSGDALAAPSRLAQVATFAGGACIYRRSIFLQTAGFVPLPLAYGMEEVDLSLRLHAAGQRIMHAPELRVVHEVAPLKTVRRIVFQGLWPRFVAAQDPGHRDTREIAAATVANLALLPFLRYPVVLWPYGLAQCLHKVIELMCNGRTREALAGLWSAPSHLWRHRGQRAPLTTAQVRSYLRLRRSGCDDEDQESDIGSRRPEA